jgi:hypothetical protein
VGLADDLSIDRVGKLVQLLQRSGLDVDDIARVERVNVWEGFLKNSEGQPEKVDMHGISLVPRWADGPEWPVVQQAAPVKARPLPAPKRSPESPRVVVILPDPQIGCRRWPDGTLDWFQDEQAIAAALRVIRKLQPTRIVNLGDTNDFPQWSMKFARSPEFADTTQFTLDRTHRFLADQRANAPADCSVDLIEGNHDKRLADFVRANAKEALRIRQADTPPESWPVLSLPHLLRLDELGVSYHAGYPAAKVKIADGNDRFTPLYAVHGEKLDVQKLARDEHQSFVQGHIHRIQTWEQTFEWRDSPMLLRALSFGCLCRIDGTVPSSRSGEDGHGRPTPVTMNWQHGVGVVHVWPDGSWSAETVPIVDGVAYLRGERW